MIRRLVGTAWNTITRRRPRPSSATTVWAVRRDWPEGGHEFVRACPSEAAAGRQLAKEKAYWRPPLRPALTPVSTRPDLSLVSMSDHDFRLHGRHRRRCWSPDCPRPAVSATVRAGL